MAGAHHLKQQHLEVTLEAQLRRIVHQKVINLISEWCIKVKYINKDYIIIYKLY